MFITEWCTMHTASGIVARLALHNLKIQFNSAGIRAGINVEY